MNFKRINGSFGSLVVNSSGLLVPAESANYVRRVATKILSNEQAQVLDDPFAEGMSGFYVVPIAGARATLKRLFDILFSLVAIIVLLPVYAVIAVLIKLDSSGPVLFKQKRHGLDCREIEVWKFRSMKVLENDGTVQQAKRNDSRVTRIGKYLRKTSLDELPQFFNVLQGTMTVVGPRPHALAHNAQYSREIDDYMLRHMVKPGITGWAQINGLRGETDTTDKMAERVRFDLEYIRCWSLRFDLYIVLLTIMTGFNSKNAY